MMAFVRPRMTEEVPVKFTDLLLLGVVSLGGGILIASLILTPTLSTQFISVIFLGTMLLAFFLFIPVLGVRLFLEERNDESE
ncbi:hypothetical protein C495_11324 [Natronorubrum sulfidifaciens JCM 14089]|uniref:Uncharacterized protein n=2 Tax=Natronorubrum sulfidifaciens TaxID=388259 RepID=L9W4X0_9EURY|nr:hypothetical protein C495_11324 [Natronorubrum sulfidifaciens JCM 14089]